MTVRPFFPIRQSVSSGVQIMARLARQGNLFSAAPCAMRIVAVESGRIIRSVLWIQRAAAEEATECGAESRRVLPAWGGWAFGHRVSRPGPLPRGEGASPVGAEQSSDTRYSCAAELSPSPLGRGKGEGERDARKRKTFARGKTRREIVAHSESQSNWIVQFPLTPTLSLGEREHGRPASNNRAAPTTIALPNFTPLPWEREHCRPASNNGTAIAAIEIVRTKIEKNSEKIRDSS